MTDLEIMRQRGVSALAAIGWATVAIELVMSSYTTAGFSWTPVLTGVLCNLAPTYYALRRRADLSARLAASLMLVMHPAILLAIMRGSPWQTDMHIFFFVALAGLIIFCDWRLYIPAGMLIAVHHLTLNMLMPNLLYTEQAGFDRVLIHALGVCMASIVLGRFAYNMHAMRGKEDAARLESERLMREANDSRDRSHAALQIAQTAEARVEEAARQRSQAEVMEQQRRSDEQHQRSEQLHRVAAHFEASVANVAGAVARAATVLDGSAGSLNTLADGAQRQARAVAIAAAGASEMAQAVAGEISVLTRSADSVAQHARQQAELVDLARDRSAAGARAVKLLAETTDNIASIANLISSIASQTNLLSLNATIEAARAGEAGQGFAVVAQEVKALAGQVGRATSDIVALVANIASRADDAESSFDGVVAAVGQLSEASISIRRAAEEQGEATVGIEGGATQNAGVMADIADALTRVSAAASETGAVSAEVKAAATGLLGEAATLQSAAADFIAKLRAA